MDLADLKLNRKEGRKLRVRSFNPKAWAGAGERVRGGDGDPVGADEAPCDPGLSMSVARADANAVRGGVCQWGTDRGVGEGIPKLK